jgi:hypothetical protein
MLGPGQPAELYVTLEGESGGLPVYCCMLSDLRVEGRAVPARLVFDPQTAGIADAEIEWIDLRPTPDAKGWRRARYEMGRYQWALPITSFPGDPSPGIDAAFGTARFAASVRFRNRDGAFATLGTDGWTVRPDWTDPRSAPGFRVTRYESATLFGRSLGLARLPFMESATNEHAWERVALRQADLFLCAYEDLSGGPLPKTVRAKALEGPEWNWLLTDAVRGAHLRGHPLAAAVGPQGRPVPWLRRADDSVGVAYGDIVLASGKVAILDADDGDGWLGNGDRVVHAAKGRLARGTLGELPAGMITVRRPKNFSKLVEQISAAGYGPLIDKTVFSPGLRKAIRSFQHDHGLPDNGLPDDATLHALDEFLARVAKAGDAAPADSAR